MTSPCRDRRALGQYVEIIRTSLLTREFRERIAGRERSGDFPFNVHNIYRVLFAVEPVLLEGWSAVAAARPLTASDPRLGTSLRCLRYLHVLLVAAGSTDASTAETVLEPMAERALGMRREPHCFCAGHPADPEPPARTSPDVALRLASALRQYTDVRWLGQHDQGFTGRPPSRGPSGQTRYTRCFGRLPPRFRHRCVSVTVAYDGAQESDLVFDVFRGELTRTPPRDAVSWCAVMAGDSRQALTDEQCERMLAETRDALRTARAALPADPRDGDPAVADMFMGELLAAMRQAGLDEDACRGRVRARLSRLSLAAPSSRTMTDAYLDRLGDAVQRWSEHPCPGS